LLEFIAVFYSYGSENDRFEDRKLGETAVQRGFPPSVPV